MRDSVDEKGEAEKPKRNGFANGNEEPRRVKQAEDKASEKKAK